MQDRDQSQFGAVELVSRVERVERGRRHAAGRRGEDVLVDFQAVVQSGETIAGHEVHLSKTRAIDRPSEQHFQVLEVVRPVGGEPALDNAWIGDQVADVLTETGGVGVEKRPGEERRSAALGGVIGRLAADAKIADLESDRFARIEPIAQIHPAAISRSLVERFVAQEDGCCRLAQTPAFAWGVPGGLVVNSGGA